MGPLSHLQEERRIPAGQLLLKTLALRRPLSSGSWLLLILLVSLWGLVRVLVPLLVVTLGPTLPLPCLSAVPIPRPDLGTVLSTALTFVCGSQPALCLPRPGPSVPGELGAGLQKSLLAAGPPRSLLPRWRSSLLCTWCCVPAWAGRPASLPSLPSAGPSVRSVAATLSCTPSGPLPRQGSTAAGPACPSQRPLPCNGIRDLQVLCLPLLAALWFVCRK